MGRGTESTVRRSRTNTKKAKEEKEENCMLDVNGSDPLVTDSTGNGNKKKKGRDNDTIIAEDDGGEKDPKRHCSTTATATKSSEEEALPNNNAGAAGAGVGIVTCVSSDVDNDNDHDGPRVLSLLPTGIQLSKELCKIVSDRYSHDESLRALDKLFQWSYTKDSTYLNCFDRYSGIIRVFDFLKESITKKKEEDGSALPLPNRMMMLLECIEKASSVIQSVCFVGVDGVNTDIATKIATSAILDCDGIQTLILASEECTNNPRGAYQFKALNTIWAAVRNITSATTCTIYTNKDQATILYTGMNIISQLNKSIHDVSMASTVLVYIVATFSTIVKNKYATQKYFREKRILTNCLDLVKKNNNKNPSEMLTYTVIMFFHRCHSNNLFSDHNNMANVGSSCYASSSDYELVFPFFGRSIKKFPTNHKIRKIVIDFINSIATVATNPENNSYKKKKSAAILEKGGAMEILGVVLAFNHIKQDEKKKVRALISTIANNAGIA
mmetsp:Transcript_58368/g.67295  ORF Transcript_58368/g.67295 Transcript_58368/m.67295 type:complete len:498 (-) Transcript_58368:318-1811(-)